MAPRNLFLSITLGAISTLAHPFAFAAKAAGAAARSLGWGARQMVGSRRAKADTGWTAELLKQLEWRRFEELCAAYFQALGFRAELAFSGVDGSAGISLFAQGAERASIVVQCKPWNAYRVGIKAVRGLRALMSSADVGEGVLVSSGKFTQEARTFAARENISLVDGDELLVKIAALAPETAQGLLKFATEGDYVTPTCPSCAVKMIRRKSTSQGRAFWGCRNYPGCKQTLFDSV